MDPRENLERKEKEVDLEKMALWGPKEKRARLGDMGWTDQKVKRACRASLDLG